MSAFRANSSVAFPILCGLQGRKVAAQLFAGELVPDEITVELIKRTMLESGADNFILDGFPRTVAQAEAFEKEVKMPSAAILLECPQDVLEKRVVKRGGSGPSCLGNGCTEGCKRGCRWFRANSFRN
jgi:adenylate kinase family enzyme